MQIAWRTSERMPNIKSVKKDVVRSRQRQQRNQSYKSRMKTMVKKTRAAIMEHRWMRR